jgi:hypothetical protein
MKLTTHLHLVPRSKNEWSYTSTPQHAFMARCSVKKRHTDNFTFPAREEHRLRAAKHGSVRIFGPMTGKKTGGGGKVHNEFQQTHGHEIRRIT